MLFRVGCFEEFCKEEKCWGLPYLFATQEAKMNYFNNADVWPDYVPFESEGEHGEVILMSGVPGAGKNTYITKHYPDLHVVSLDDIRNEMKISPTDKSGNGKVIQEAKERARIFMRMKKSFIWNGTNVTRQMRQQLIDLFLQYKMRVKIVYIEVPYSKIHSQNTNRDAMVPRNVVDKLISKLEVPSLVEAHEIEYFVK